MVINSMATLRFHRMDKKFFFNCYKDGPSGGVTNKIFRMDIDGTNLLLIVGEATSDDMINQAL